MSSRRTVLSVIALAAIAVPLALAQPGGRLRITSSWLHFAQGSLGDEGLQKELKLTPDQAKKATEQASTASSRTFTYYFAEDKEREKLDADIKKELESFLKAEQMTRLREVVLQ